MNNSNEAVSGNIPPTHEPDLTTAIQGVVAKAERRYRSLKIFGAASLLLGVGGLTFGLRNIVPASSNSKISANTTVPFQTASPNRSNGLGPKISGAPGSMIPDIASQVAPTFTRQTSQNITINYDVLQTYPTRIMCPQAYGAPSPLSASPPITAIASPSPQPSPVVGSNKQASTTVVGSTSNTQVSGTVVGSGSGTQGAGAVSGTGQTSVIPCLTTGFAQRLYSGSIAMNISTSDGSNHLFFASMTPTGLQNTEPASPNYLTVGFFTTNSGQQVLVAAVPDPTGGSTLTLSDPSSKVLDTASSASFSNETDTATSPWLVVASYLPTNTPPTCQFPGGYLLALSNSTNSTNDTYVIPPMGIGDTTRTCMSASFTDSFSTGSNSATTTVVNPTTTTTVPSASSQPIS